MEPIPRHQNMVVFFAFFVPGLVRSADSDYLEKCAKHSSTPEMKNDPRFTEILTNRRQFINCSVDLMKALAAAAALIGLPVPRVK